MKLFGISFEIWLLFLENYTLIILSKKIYKSNQGTTWCVWHVVNNFRVKFNISVRRKTYTIRYNFGSPCVMIITWLVRQDLCFTPPAYAIPPRRKLVKVAYCKKSKFHADELLWLDDVILVTFFSIYTGFQLLRGSTSAIKTVSDTI